MLSALVAESLEADPGVVTPVLRRGRPETEVFAAALGLAAARGADVRWDTVFPGARGTDLPLYAFQRQRYWLDAPTTVSDAAGFGLVPADHPLLGVAVPLADRDEHVLTGRLARGTHPWLTEHAVAGTVLVPGTGLLELALRAGEQLGATTVGELTLAAPLVLPERGGVHLQVSVGAEDTDATRQLRIHTRPDGDPAHDGTWTLHAHGTLRADGATAGRRSPSGPRRSPRDRPHRCLRASRRAGLRLRARVPQPAPPVDGGRGPLRGGRPRRRPPYRVRPVHPPSRTARRRAAPAAARSRR
ncbi:polyketide synthase dehydratase domain-containing protein [Streptomyces sp. JCM17656]|nr:polyketide synthase dehydratase domain-containing protein [Streptomyces sp. JCM17656]